jgi:phosphatidate cytidylyltransferase
MLCNRILTALVAIPIVLLTIIYAKAVGVFFIIFFIITMALYEYFSFLYPEKINIQIVAHILLGLLFPLAFFFGYPELVVQTTAFVFLAVMAFSLFRVTDPQKKAENLFIRMFGIFYIAFLLSFLIILSQIPEDGWKWAIMTVAINFGSDVGGYVAGRLFGKHKLYEAISPKKTVEGTIGAVLFCVLVVFVFAKYILGFKGVTLSLWDILALGIGGSILAVLGDMTESLIKRGFKVKDASGLLPGHGGFLDRTDSFVFSLPFIYYYVSNLY